MIAIFEALSWLNQYDVSHLSPAVLILTLLSHDARQSDSEKAAMLRNLQALAQVSPDRLEIAEIHMHCAALEYWRDSFSEAAKHVRRALQEYQSDTHRAAVAQWMLGMAQWRTLQNENAYVNWNYTRASFFGWYKSFSSLPPRRLWYRDRLKEMEIDLATKPEEIFCWLNKYEGTKLSPPSQAIVNQIKEKINRRDYSTVFDLFSMLQDINRWSSEIYEQPEAYLVCGYHAYQTGNWPLAIDFIKKAVLGFALGVGGNHKQVIARWMCGAVGWMGKDIQIAQARIDWLRCISDLEQLRLRADQENDPDRRDWYAGRRYILQSSLSMYLPS